MCANLGVAVAGAAPHIPPRPTSEQRMRMANWRTAALVIALIGLAASANAQRQRYSLDPAWRFTRGDSTGAQAVSYDDHQWRTVDLPHDWSIEGPYVQTNPGAGRIGFLPTGIGWYRKTFTAPATASRGETWLQLDGVYMNSDVWINGTLLGHRPYGYSTQRYNLTSHLVRGRNLIAVRVDNSAQPNSRYYTGSGISRHTWLITADSLHVAQWGTVVSTPSVDSVGASVVIRTRIENDHLSQRDGILRSVVVDAGGREVARGETPFAVAGAKASDVELRVTVAHPLLWSPATPNMYALRQSVIVGTRTIDDVETPFGMRTIAFDKDRGFLLNGVRVKLNGVNLHHDAGAVGAAVPEAVWARRFRTLKEMGANAIRTSHNPFAPEFLDLADRMGFLVMDEAFDEWMGGKVPEGYHKYFTDWSTRDLEEFVRRDRNHPSVVLWSAGNEIGEQSSVAGAAILKRLVDIIHREDPTRLVTTGNDKIYADNGPARVEFLNALDVVGYNYIDRWHERRELYNTADRHDHPEWKTIGTESSSLSGGMRGTYSLGADSTRVQPSYAFQMIRPEQLWKFVASHDYYAGDFMWTGIDYLGETQWPSKGASSGPIDMAGFRKDAFYFYQSQWTTQPVLHLMPHWNWPGREGQLIPVIAYTNCSSVELFLNDRSMGEKRLEFPRQGTSGGWNTYARPQVMPTTSDLHLSWDVPYAPGVLRAVGKREGKECSSTEVRTAGAPASMRVRVDRDSITSSAGDVAHVTVEIVDANGTLVPTADNIVHFRLTGGEVVATDNGNLRDLEPFASPDRHAFNGMALLIARSAAPGRIRIDVSADGLKGSSVDVDVRAGPPIPTIR